MAEQETPKAPISEADFRRDGNVFAIMAACSRALNEAGMGTRVEEMRQRVFASGSYTDALAVLLEYVEFTVSDGADDDGDEEEGD